MTFIDRGNNRDDISNRGLQWPTPA
jgi:hypothetical protein